MMAKTMTPAAMNIFILSRYAHSVNCQDRYEHIWTNFMARMMTDFFLLVIKLIYGQYRLYDVLMKELLSMMTCFSLRINEL